METTIAQLISLNTKVAIVTGGAMGIGQAIAQRLHEAGANVVIADRKAEDAEATAAELNAVRADSALARSVDVSNADEVASCLSATLEAFGQVDILVNNAGIFPSKTIAEMEESDFMNVVNVNLKGVFLMTKHVSDQMVKQGKGGKIINVTSIDALHPSMVGLAHYDSSKHGVWGFTKNAALELSQHNITVNALAPGGIATPGVADMQPKDGPVDNSVIEAFMQKIPMHRMGEPDEIGKVALFLASDFSSYMTGSQVVVDGGALLS